MQTAIITGASRGLGAEIACALASRGYRLAIAARDRAALDLVRAELGDVDVLVCPGDLRLEEVRSALVAACLDRWGYIGVLVNNAAVAHVAGIDRIDRIELAAMVDTNLGVPLELIRAVTPSMVANGSGRILNIASTFGLAGAPYLATYSATKAGMRALGWSLNLELGSSGVRVTTAIPGPIAGDTMLDRIDQEAGGLPWMPATHASKAARRAVKAMERGRAEVVITPGGRVATRSRRMGETATRILGITSALEQLADKRTNQAPPEHQGATR